MDEQRICLTSPDTTGVGMFLLHMNFGTTCACMMPHTSLSALFATST